MPSRIQQAGDRHEWQACSCRHNVQWRGQCILLNAQDAQVSRRLHVSRATQIWAMALTDMIQVVYCARFLAVLEWHEYRAWQLHLHRGSP